jgi:hypothetical protein
MRSRIGVPVACLLLAGCASLIGGGTSQNLNVSSTPSAATFVVKSSSGLQMAQGTSGAAVRLPRKNEYQIDITAPGYQPQTVAVAKGINGWFWANLLFGGVIGMIIDGADGAMYKLEPSIVSVTLARATSGDDAGEMFSTVSFYSESGKLLREQRTKLIPAK